MSKLITKWDKLMRNLGQFGHKPDMYWLELRVLYESPDRFYHTLQHINDVYDNYKYVGGNSPNIVEALAIFYHDAVYNTKASDNEERSAEYAVEVAQSLGCGRFGVRHVKSLIYATKDHKPLQSTIWRETSEIFLDSDLSILGVSKSKYEAYSKNIRKEYEWVEEKVYKEKRSEILESFLRKPHIFYTSSFRAKYEEAAKTNIKWELELLNV